MTFGAVSDTLIEAEKVFTGVRMSVFAKALRLAQSCLFFKRLTQLMNIRLISAILAAIFLATGLPSAVNAAFYDGTDTLISGQASFFSAPSQLYGYVDYAVYSPGYFAGSDSFPAGKYAYCYQIFDSSTSSAIGRFTVNLDSGVTAYSPGDFVFSTGGITTLSETVSPTTIVFLFNNRAPITANHHSSVLFYAGDFGPETGSGIIAGIMTGSASVEIPTPAPTPEPASLLLFALAAPFLLKTRRRKS